MSRLSRVSRLLRTTHRKHRQNSFVGLKVLKTNNQRKTHTPTQNTDSTTDTDLSHSLMPTSCPIKTNPVHKVFIDDRKQIREDVIWSRTVVKKDYIGNLFRPSKRFLAKKKKKKVVRSKRKKISVNGTMGSYDSTEKHGKEEDEGWHSLGSEADGSNMLLRRSTSAFFPKSKRGLKKHKPWGPSLQNSTPTTLYKNS